MPAAHGTPVAFKQLALTFDALERTSSSTAMIGILARFLPKLSPREARFTAYLLSGTVGPSFSAPEFGMAEKMIARAVAQACDVPAERVQRLAVRAGDLGDVAERLSAGRRARLTIADVFASLERIARTAGAGAQQVKVDELAGLVRRTSALEAKYVVRTVLGTHRVGAAEMTFLRALAKAFGGAERDLQTVERAYNLLADLGAVAERAARGGVRSLSRVAPTPGVPIRMMLATRVEDLDEVPRRLPGELFAEYKYDGERLQVHKDARGTLRAFSRRLEDITHQYPEVIEHLRRNLAARTAILEGEVVAIDAKRRRLLPFQTLMQRKRKLQIERYRREVPVALFAFDLLYRNGKSLLGTGLASRKQLLTTGLKTDGVVAIGTYIRTAELAEVEEYFREAVARGAEGVVIKGAASPYQPGRRGWNWIKYKKEYERELADTFDVVVVGALWGKGARAGRYGSLLVAAFDPLTNRYASFTKVGAGFTDALLRALPAKLKPYVIPQRHRLVDTGMAMDVWFEPAVVLEIAGADLTISPVHVVARRTLKAGGIALRFPRLVRVRDDKMPEQATTTSEILRMYRQRMRAGRAR